MLSFLTILHPLVDACSVTVLVIGGMSWQRVLAYNALAFALQFPIGVMLDVRPCLLKGAFVVSLALTLAGVGLCMCGLRGVALMSACVGNALFHLSAGKAVLDLHGGRGGPVGLFISTGAFGLFVGMKLSGGYGPWCCLGFGAALGVVGVLSVRAWKMDCTLPALNGRVARFLGGWPLSGCLLLFGLFAIVAWRSWSGLLAGEMTNSVGLGFALAGALVMWAGKAAGGCLGDCFGRWRVTAVSVVGSLLLCLLCRPDQEIVWLVLLFIAQLATGPVLSLLYDNVGRAGGTAFGLNCLGLFTGSL